MAKDANTALPVSAATVQPTTVASGTGCNISIEERSQQQQRHSSPSSIAPLATESARLATTPPPNQSCQAASIFLGGSPVAVGLGSREQRPLNQWSAQMVWTRRQSPEWKPRRASVATCQLQQRQQHKQHSLPDAAAADASIRKLLSQHRHQRRLLAALGTSLTPDYQIEVSSVRAADVDYDEHDDERHGIIRTANILSTTKTSELGVDFASSGQQQRQPSQTKADHFKSQRPQAGACCDKCSTVVANSSSERRTTLAACLGSARVQRDLTLAKTTTTIGVKPTRQAHDTAAERELEQQSPEMLAARQANIGSQGEVNRSSSLDSPKGSGGATCGRARRQGFMRTTSGALSCANSRQHSTAPATRATCYCPSCNGQQQQQWRSVIACTAATAAAAFSSSATADVEEKLQSQDKQRKFLIFSMAMKQLLAAAELESASAGGTWRSGSCCCIECRLRVPGCCAFIKSQKQQTVCPTQRANNTSKAAIARDPPLLGRHHHYYQKRQGQPASESRVALSGSRSSLVDRLLVTGGISSANSNICAAAAACSLDSAPTCCQVAIDAIAACSTEKSTNRVLLSPKRQPPPQHQHQEQRQEQQRQDQRQHQPRQQQRRRRRQQLRQSSADDESACGGSRNSANGTSGADSADSANKARADSADVVVGECSNSSMSALLLEFGASETRALAKSATVSVSSNYEKSKTANDILIAREALTGSSSCSDDDDQDDNDERAPETDDSSEANSRETGEKRAHFPCDQESNLIGKQQLAANQRPSVRSSSSEDRNRRATTNNCPPGSTWSRRRPHNHRRRRQHRQENIQQQQRRRLGSTEPTKSDLGEESDGLDIGNDSRGSRQAAATMASSQWRRQHPHHGGHQSHFDQQADLELTTSRANSAFAALGSLQDSNACFKNDLSHCSAGSGTNSQHQQQCDLNLESLIVESWLDDHPDFVHDYFMRKANHQLVDDWLIAHAKAVSNTNLSSSLGSTSAVRADAACGGDSLLAAASSANCATNNNNNNHQQHLEQCSRSRQISQHSLTSQLKNFLGSRTAESDSSSSPPPPPLTTVVPQPPEIISTASSAAAGVSTTNSGPQPSQASFVAPILTLTMNTAPFISAAARHNRSSSHSGANTPVRKISATDFESKTGSGFLRPMVSTTPDGRPTFLSQLVLSDDEDITCRHLNLEAVRQRHNRPPQTVHERQEQQHHQNHKNRRPSEQGSSGPVLTDSTTTTTSRLDDRSEVRKTDSTTAHETGAATADCDERPKKANPPEMGREKSRVGQQTGCDCAEDDYDQENCELKLIFELVKNICNDLDIRTLLHKILKNIALLINADKSSLFLVCGRAGDPNRHLVSQLFNVDRDSELVENEPPEEGECIRIPWGTGLVGYVAESGESLNIENCYEDPRFTNTIDQRTGYVTRHMLCAPIFDKRNEIVGVAQVINKRDGNPFSKSDEIKFRRYLQFCGIGLRNAQSYEHCQLENRRNQVLLDLARMVFEEQSTIEQVVYRIMLHTQSLLECQRCQVLLIDDGSDDLEQLLQLPTSYGCSGTGSSGITRGGGFGPNNAAACADRLTLSRRRRRIGAAAAAASQAGGRTNGGGYHDDDDRNEDQEAPKPEWHPQCSGHARSGASDKCQLEDGSGAPSDDDGVGGRSGACESQQKRRRPNCSALDLSATGYHRQQQREKPQLVHQAPKLFSLVFDLECEGNGDDRIVMHSSKDAGGEDNTVATANKNSAPSSQANHIGSQRRSQFPINIGITGYVAMTGETLNIEDAHQCDRFDPSVDENSNFRHKSILCMPIRNGQRQIIGVSQLINKKNGRPFNKNDEDLFEAFAIFCGLGIHNTLMYEKVLKIMAKQRVTFEVLSYHATAPLEEAKKLNMEQIPSCFTLNLTSLKFNDFSLDEQFMLKSCLRFFLDLDLIRRFQIDQLVFCNWILSVQKNYRKVTYHPIVGGNGLKAAPVRYHNWRHAFNVSQMMFAILINTQICQPLGELETLALLIACLCHDLDHRGTNNSFQIKSASPLAELYSTSTMEHHHFDQCVMILNSQGNQILANLSPDEYSRVIVLLEEAILATDLANYFQRREAFFQLVNGNQFEWQRNPEHRSLLRCMLMTACDVAAITKPWSVQKVVADLVMSEFYQQGDIEKQELNIEPIDMMNRDKMSKLPEMQIGFIDSICAPIYSAFARLFPRELSPLLEGCLANRNLWADLAQQQANELAISSSGNDNSISNDKLEQQQPQLIATDSPLISYLNKNNNNNWDNNNTSSGTNNNKKTNKSESAISMSPKGLASASSLQGVDASFAGASSSGFGANLLPNQNHYHHRNLHHHHKQKGIPHLDSSECIDDDGNTSSSCFLTNTSKLTNSETRPISATASTALTTHNNCCEHQFSKVDYQRKSV